jgi:cyclic pyranopterin phosphate synthase
MLIRKMSTHLTHLNSKGKAVMVNISNKKENLRTAIAKCTINVPDNIYKAVIDNNIKKGDVFTVSRLAGIINTKKTSDIIPLCHPLNVSDVKIDIVTNEKNTFEITSKVETVSNTGVEIESLVAVTTSALTFYDMCKALSKDIIIKNIQLIKKTGGKSDYLK